MSTGTITISQYTANPPVQLSADSLLEVRSFYNRDYISIDGVTPIFGNFTNGEQGPYFSTTPTLDSSNNLVVPAHSVQVTVGANPTANYFEGLWVDGAFVCWLMPNTQSATGWQIPSVYGDPIAYDQIATYNRARRLVYPPDSYFTADQVIEEIRRLAGDFLYAAVGVNGITSMDVAPASASLPIAVGANSYASTSHLGIARSSVAPLVSTVPIFLGVNDVRVGAIVNAKGAPYYAKGDGVTDDRATIQAALDDLAGTRGTVILPASAQNYLCSGSLTVPEGVWLIGTSPTGTTIQFTASSGSGVILGDLSAVALIYGTGLANLQLYSPQPGFNTLLTIAGTSDATVKDVLLQGAANVATVTLAIRIDGASIGNQHTSIENVRASHVKYGQHWTGMLVTAVNNRNFNVLSNQVPIANSVGYLIDSSNGNGSCALGGNIESMAIGIDYTGNGATFIGTRFESNTNNVTVRATGSGLSMVVPLNWDTAKFSDASGNTTQIIAPFDGTSPANALQSILGPAQLNGNLMFQRPVSPNPRNVTLDAPTDQSLRIQAGIGTATDGGSIVMYGANNGSHPNDTVVAGTNGQFRVNNGGLDSGNDNFVVSMATGQVKITNIGRLTIAPKTNQSYSNAMTIDVTISNHVISAVSGTSATSTWTPSAAGSAGDILMITTEADASGTVTITFGGSFHALTTQVTTASHFSTITFQSDGTRWLEAGRVTNLA